MNVILLFLGKILLALFIFAITFVVSSWFASFIKKRAFENDHIDPTLASFLASTTRYALLIIGFIIAINTAGVNATVMTAIAGAATLALGLALQGVLGNFAAGVMIMLFRPYKLGDYVVIAGQAGSVIDIKMVFTILTTLDNVTIIVPNGKAWSEVITNYAQQETRRVDQNYYLVLPADRNLAETAALEALKQSEYLLQEPEAFCKITDIDDGRLVLTVRGWVNRIDYGAAKTDFLAKILDRLYAEAIELAPPKASTHHRPSPPRGS